MSKINDYAQDFLEQGGNALGFDEKNMPEFKDLDMVLRFGVYVWEYKGLTEYEYYGGNQ